VQAEAAPSANDVEESFRFDEQNWSAEEFKKVLSVRRAFVSNLRPHDGLPNVTARAMLLRCAHYDPAALLSWAHHTKRMELLQHILSLGDHHGDNRLFLSVLQYAPRLPIIEAVLAVRGHWRLDFADGWKQRQILTALLKSSLRCSRPDDRRWTPCSGCSSSCLC
jgi:hypothetical protein